MTTHHPSVKFLENTMSTFKPTLAANADFAKITYPVYASPKLDGIRCIIVDGKALTRSLKDVPNIYTREMLSTLELDGLDGELIMGSPTSKTCYRDTSSAVMGHYGEPELTFYVFDSHTATGTFTERLAHLQSMPLPCNVVLLEQVLLSNEAEMLAYEAAKVAEGYEGIILRSPTAPYKHGRSTTKEGYLLKVKRFEDSEAIIIGFEEEMFNGNEVGTNELGRTFRSQRAEGMTGKGRLGAFTVQDVGSGIVFSVGTGLTAADRSEFWGAQDSLIGQILKYKFFPVGVKVAPRHPVFLGMRDMADMSA